MVLGSYIRIYIHHTYVLSIVLYLCGVFLRIIIIKLYVTTWKMYIYIILFYRKNKQARSSTVHIQHTIHSFVHIVPILPLLLMYFIRFVPFQFFFFIFYFLLYNIFCCCWSWVLFCLTWFNNSRKCVWKKQSSSSSSAQSINVIKMGTEGGMVVAYQGWHQHIEAVQVGLFWQLVKVRADFWCDMIIFGHC